MAALTISGRAPALPRDALVTETAREYVVHLAVPGFRPDDLDVEVVEHTVTVRGDRTHTDAGEFRLRDRLEERVELPRDADPAGLTAWYPAGRARAARSAISRRLPFPEEGRDQTAVRVEPGRLRRLRKEESCRLQVTNLV